MGGGVRLPAVGEWESTLEPPCTGSLVPRARVSSGGNWGGGGADGACGAVGGAIPLLSPCRHPEVLPGHPHDAGLQAGLLLQGLLAVPVPSHAPGNQGGREGCWLGARGESRALLGIQSGRTALALSGPLLGLGDRMSTRILVYSPLPWCPQLL